MDKRELNKIFNDKKIEAIVTTQEQTRLWFANVAMSAGMLILEKDKSILFADGRYFEMASKNAKNVEVKLFTKENIEKFFKSKKYKTVGIESNTTLKEFDYLKKLIGFKNHIQINGQELRIIKSKDEINIMSKAGKIAIKSFDELKKEIKVGMTEIEVANMIDALLRKNGAFKSSFEPIVVSGKRGSLPHGNPSTKKIKNGDYVTIDFGALYKGYASDVTRTIKVGEAKNIKMDKVYEVVKRAQRAGVQAVKPGVKTNDIDKVCRDIITEAGYGQYFIHSTGHGLGIDVHELPNVTSNKEFNTELREGMVITVEPGIYIPGLGGVRIEDDVLVTKNGNRVLSE